MAEMTFIKKYGLYLAFALSLVAMLASLFFSEVMKWAPCVLCWYQRVVMYPLVIITAVGIIRKDLKVYLYILPLTIIGLLISIYHNLLYYKILPENALPCLNGVSCTTKYIEWFGFVTIPLLSFCAFVLLTGLMLAYRQAVKEN